MHGDCRKQHLPFSALHLDKPIRTKCTHSVAIVNALVTWVPVRDEPLEETLPGVHFGSMSYGIPLL